MKCLMKNDSKRGVEVLEPSSGHPTAGGQREEEISIEEKEREQPMRKIDQDRPRRIRDVSRRCSLTSPVLPSRDSILECLCLKVTTIF